MSFENSLYILNIYDMTCGLQMFSHSVACFHTLNKVFHRADIFSFVEIQFTLLVFYGYVLVSIRYFLLGNSYHFSHWQSKIVGTFGFCFALLAMKRSKQAPELCARGWLVLSG